MLRAGDVVTQRASKLPGRDHKLSTTGNLLRLSEMCVLFAWRRHCTVVAETVETKYDSTLRVLTARFDIQ